MKSKVNLFKKPVVFLAAYAVFLLTVSEWISRGSLMETMVWAVPHIGVTITAIVLIFNVLVVIYLLTRRLKVSLWVTTIPVVVLSIVNYYKILMNSKPLTVWDFGLIDELLKIQGDMSFTIAWHVVFISILVIAVLVVISRKLGKKQNFEGSLKKQIGQLVVALAAMAAVIFGVYLQPKVFGVLGFDDTPYNQVTFYENNGFINSFIYGINDKLALTSVELTAEAQAVIDAQTAFLADVPQPEQRPNIILLLNESFMDVTKIENVTFNQDPLPTYRALTETTVTGEFVSSQFGGGTSNVEYDVLTGHTSFDLPKGMVPYTQLIHQPIQSLPQLLASYGYQNTSLHSYSGWFWNRESVHKSLGFERFLDETTFVDPTLVGPYISDADFINKVIETFETNKAADADKPQFIFGISMQNHAPYGGESKSISADVPIEIIDAPGLDSESIEELEDYAQSTYLSDKALQTLLEYFETVDEPTVIVQFGDHLPSMSTILTDAGYLNNAEQDPMDQALAKYTTPIVFWDNYNQLAQSEEKELGYLGANYVSTTLLQAAQLPLSPYFQFLQDTKNVTGMPFFEYALLPDGNVVTDIPQKIRDAYRYLESYFLFGN
ncbi:MAG: LTA synthase family protein [Culicoidibacterales bacterium]